MRSKGLFIVNCSTSCFIKANLSFSMKADIYPDTSVPDFLFGEEAPELKILQLTCLIIY
jgi:hypothetical protein